MTDIEEIPLLVGHLNAQQGVKYFEKAEVGHPVFEIKDRYIIYLKSEIELKERVYNPSLQGHETKVGFFLVAIPYYKRSLHHVIDFV